MWELSELQKVVVTSGAFKNKLSEFAPAGNCLKILQAAWE